MKQTLFLLPKDDSRNSADKQTHKKKATLCLCLFLCTGVAFPNDLAAKAAISSNSRMKAGTLIQQQTKRVSGTITDSSGIPIIGANVVEDGTTNGTITDFDGKFVLEVNTRATLRISYIGYIEKKIQIASQSVLNIQLTEDTQNLDEVVVVGYGTQKKVNLTGAISNIKADMMENRTTSNAVNMMTGQVSGVTIIQNTGQPGADAGSLRVRGVGTLGKAEAMVIIDGVESSLNSVDPNDIQDISILKDAAASSIYGVRAANGVILVTTKKGAAGKTNVSYNGYVGWQSATRLPKYLDSYGYATLLNEAYANDNMPKPYDETALKKFQDGSDPDHFANSDWLGTLLSENGLFHNHHLNVTGGSEAIRYSVSFGFHDKKGLIPNMNYNKFNVRANLDAKVNDRLDFSLNMAAYRDRQAEPAIGISNLGRTGDGASNIIHYAFRETPVTPIQFQNGQYGLFKNEHNSVATAREGGLSRIYNNNFQGSASFVYKIIEGLTLRGNAGAIFNLLDQHVFSRSINFYSADSKNPIKTTRNMAQNYDKKMLEINLQAYLNYEKTFGKHGIKALAGYSQLYNQYRYVSALRKDLPSSNSLGEINAGNVTTQETQGNLVEYALRSAFGRINYSFDDRYLLEGNIRYEGTSRFPKNSRFGAFPSFSAGWRISEEDFFKASWVDNLKLRASWGQLGNQEIGNYAFYNTYAFGYDYSYNNVLTPGISITPTMANKNITCETTSQVDVGVDADFLNGKLSFTGDFFLKNTSDILLSLPIPEIVGVDAPMQNAGKVRNTGVELSLRHNNNIRDFNYHATFNISYVHNEITDLSGGDIPGRSVGDPINNIYGYVCEGIFQNQAEIDAHPKQVMGTPVPGDLKYADLNGDKVIDEKDRKSLGNYFPKLNFGLNLGFNYKNFDFSTLLQGAGMVDGIVKAEISRAFYNGGKVTEAHLDRWTPENPDATYPRLSMRNSNKNWQTSTFWMQNAAYVKMRNLQIGYTIPSKLLANSGISRLRFYFSADNLFTITGFDGADPEAAYDFNNQASTELSRGGSYYPLTRNYSFGVNLSF